MKKLIALVLVMVCVLGMVSCSVKTYKGTDELMEKARKELPISDADTIDMQYAGMCGVDNKAIAWFISGNEYQSHYYLPMEIEIKENYAEYIFVHTHTPMMDRVNDVAMVNWNQGYAFLINNPEITTIQMTLPNGEVVEEVIQKGAIPYTFYVSFIPSEYIFIDAEGNKVQ